MYYEFSCVGRLCVSKYVLLRYKAYYLNAFFCFTLYMSVYEINFGKYTVEVFNFTAWLTYFIQ